MAGGEGEPLPGMPDLEPNPEQDDLDRIQADPWRPWLIVMAVVLGLITLATLLQAIFATG